MREAAIVAAVASGLLLALPGAALAQDPTEVTITGEVRHGAEAETFDPSKLVVTLNVLEGFTPLSQVSARPAPDGTFELTTVEASGRTYFLTVEYQGAQYSASRRPGELAEPVVLTVFDATNDPTVLTFDSYTVIVTGAVADDRFIEVLERAVVRNDSDTTLVPDITGPGAEMLGFLRFALPRNTYNLDVRSDLAGGEVLEVDLGFALTTPVPPTRGEPYQFEFVYRLGYDDQVVDLSRTMRFGAGSFRFVTPVEVGQPASPRLEDLGAAELEGRLLRLLEGQGIEPGERIELTVSGLPTPSAWSQFRRKGGESYFRYVVPATMAVALLALLAYALGGRRVTAGATGQRGTLLERTAALEARFHAGSVSRRRYEAERDELKRALVELSLRDRAGP